MRLQRYMGLFPYVQTSGSKRYGHKETKSPAFKYRRSLLWSVLAPAANILTILFTLLNFNNNIEFGSTFIAQLGYISLVITHAGILFIYTQTPKVRKYFVYLSIIVESIKSFKIRMREALHMNSTLRMVHLRLNRKQNTTIYDRQFFSLMSCYLTLFIMYVCQYTITVLSSDTPAMAYFLVYFQFLLHNTILVLYSFTFWTCYKRFAVLYKEMIFAAEKSQDDQSMIVFHNFLVHVSSCKKQEY